MDSALRNELLLMAAEDERVRQELARDGSLYHGYHPRMEEVHTRNAARLAAILDQHGWPGISLAGEDGEDAAWRIAQHAICDPSLQRRTLQLLQQAPADEVPRWQLAYLEDRILTLEGRPQLYGTQFDWDDHGEMNPLPLADPAGVDRRRAAMGLDSMAERILAMRAQARTSTEPRPFDIVARRREMDAWARKVGWRA